MYYIDDHHGSIFPILSMKNPNRTEHEPKILGSFPSLIMISASVFGSRSIRIREFLRRNFCHCETGDNSRNFAGSVVSVETCGLVERFYALSFGRMSGRPHVQIMPRPFNVALKFGVMTSHCKGKFLLVQTRHPRGPRVLGWHIFYFLLNTRSKTFDAELPNLVI